MDTKHMTCPLAELCVLSVKLELQLTPFKSWRPTDVSSRYICQGLTNPEMAKRGADWSCLHIP